MSGRLGTALEMLRKDCDFGMAAKVSQEAKRERNRLKRLKIDRMTNHYMATLAWGVFVIILLSFVESGYSSASTVLAMPVVMKSAAAVFAALAVGLFVCGRLKLINRASLFYDYAIFAAVLTLGSLWIAFYPQIRLFFGSINPAVLDVDSRWWFSRGPIVLVVVYLVAALIFTAVRIARIEKGRK